jgi:hypothetical protein
MKSAILLYGLLLCAWFSPVVAQPRFLAYKVNGSVTYTHKGKTQALKIGKIIPASAQVNVGTKSSLVMICEEASKPISFGPGQFVLGGFAGFCNPDDQSITASYLKYVWWQMTHPGRSQEEERKRNASAAGAVSRGCPGVDFLVPDTLNYFQADILLRWKIFASTRHRELALYSGSNTPVPLARIPVTSSFIHMDSLGDYIEPGMPLFWTILLEGNEVCERRLVQVWDSTNYNDWMSGLSASILPGSSEAEINYQKGYMMETNRFPGEAYRFYREALRLAPNEKRYRLTVKRFEKMYRVEKYK